ncbi:hypothetical protein HF086_014389 [Spodoptera exigua]|uniref:Zinc finger PHD-type domain-containing protein n=1 Tax=Spodoptera exigua TaxID=7107 RepID=A0A922SLI0_SPOEX|nr:hypothetical protein HF086_014389 [Spodoptera exigua]
MTPKGSMTTETFIEFINHLHKYRTSGPCLLIFDGAKCHLDFTIVEEAEKCGITLYCLPSNTTHELQPMDKSVYRSFEHHWDQELIKYVSQHPERTLNKTSFNVILSQVWPKCMTITNISNGFRATGLYPYNPDAIPEEAFAPSALSELPNPTNRENIAVLSAESGEQEISTANVEDSDGSGTDTENLPLYLLLKNNPNAGTPQKIDNQSTTCEIHEFLPTPKFKVLASAPRKKSMNYRAQEVTKDLFGDRATNSTSQITVPSSRVEDVPSTSSMIKINTKTPKSASVTGCTSAQPAVAATRKQTSVKTASLTADKLTESKPKRHDSKPSWYCLACKEERVDDMRQCLTCGVWYHEVCVGLIPADKIFYCSGDCLKKKMKKAD